MSQQNLSRQLLWTHLLVSLIILGLATLFIVLASTEMAERQSLNERTQVSDILKLDLIQAVESGDPDLIADLNTMVRQFHGLHRIVVYDRQQQPLFVLNNTTSSANTGHNGQTQTTPLLPLELEGHVYGYMQLTLAPFQASSYLRLLLPYLAILIPLLLLLSGLLNLWLHRRITRPLELLSQSLQRMSEQGHYHFDLQPESHLEEIVTLYQGIRLLSDTVTRSQQQLARHLQQLAHIIDLLDDLIIEFNERGMLKMANRAARELLELEEADSRLTQKLQLLPPGDTEPMDLLTLARSLNKPLHLSHLHLHTGRGDLTVEAHLIPFSATEQRMRYLLILHPQSREKQLEQALVQQSRTDPLTGLANRMAMEQRLSLALKANTPFQLLHLDLDRFHLYNEALSHQQGDKLLKELGRILQDQLPQDASLARFGGDEFAIFLPVASTEQACRVAEQILETVRHHPNLQQEEILPITLSIGITSSQQGQTLAEILKNADASRQMAKQGGGNRLHLYRSEDEKLIQHHEELTFYTRIIEALNQHRLRLYFQRIARADSRPDTGLHFEILTRIACTDGRLMSPGMFIPVAERYQLACDMDIQVIETLFEWFRQRPALLRNITRISVNLSGRSLDDPRLLQAIEQQLHQGPIEGRQLCFELTETAAIGNLQASLNLMHALKRHGCRFSLDDFGTGMSSLAYLKHFPADYLKLDGSFVKEIESDPTNLALVRIFNNIGLVFGMKTIAEFVENEQIRLTMAGLGIDYVQGYAIHRPEPLDALEQWLESDQNAGIGSQPEEA